MCVVSIVLHIIMYDYFGRVPSGDLQCKTSRYGDGMEQTYTFVCLKVVVVVGGFGVSFEVDGGTMSMCIRTSYEQ